MISACARLSENSNDYSDLVTIYRDSYGVPHIYGETDAATAFGMGYAQAEDNFHLIESNFVKALGRSTELIGEDGLLDDWLNRSLEIVAYAKRDFLNLSPRVKAICEGYSEGINYYLLKNKNISPILLRNFEPWYVLAFIRYLYYQRVLLQNYSGVQTETLKLGFIKTNSLNVKELSIISFLNTKIKGEGSNSWAVNASKTTTGNPLLFINPHLSFFGPGQVYEAHILSKSGWNFTGYTRFGFPFPYVGFGKKIGWASTDNAADLIDFYMESVTNKESLLAYNYEGVEKTIDNWQETITINNKNMSFSKKLKFYKTHHGPIVGFQNGKFLSVRMAKYESSGWLEQLYLMTKSNDLKEFKEATSRLDVQFGNYLYADVYGNIFYVYNAAIPIRSENFDWSNPVDGSIKETEWKGYHTLEELPQVLNPKSGWIQNCNGTPLLTTLNENPKKENFPNYLIVEADNYRSKNSRKILETYPSFTLELFKSNSFSTYLISAEDELPLLLQEYEESNQDFSVEISAVIDTLKNWNLRSTNHSIATTLYIHWSEIKYDLAKNDSSIKRVNLEALQKTISFLYSKYGTWQVPWGQINRLQRVLPTPNNEYKFNDSIQSLPIAGTPSWTGSIFCIWSRLPKNNSNKRYGIGGNCYVSVVEFGSKVKGYSLINFGTSADPDSEHFFDQANAFASGKYKHAYLTLDQVRKNAVKVYKPSSN